MGRIVMKQFNLEEYLANPNRQVVTRDGRKVRIICTDFDNPDYPVVAEINGDKWPLSSATNGESIKGRQLSCDLFFAPTKYTDYINLYRNGGGYFLGGGVYTSEENAKYIANGDNQYITTIKVEWEE